MGDTESGFYLDTDLPGGFDRGLRTVGLSAVTARSGGLRFADDDEHLLEATRLGLVLISHNAKAFYLLHRAWRRWTAEWKLERTHAPILVMAQAPLTALVAAVLAAVAAGLPNPNEMCSWRPRRGWRSVP